MAILIFSSIACPFVLLFRSNVTKLARKKTAEKTWTNGNPLGKKLQKRSKDEERNRGKKANDFSGGNQLESEDTLQRTTAREGDFDPKAWPGGVAD